MLSFTKTRAVLGVLLLIGGGAGAAYHAGFLGKPDVILEDKGDWGTVTSESIEVVTTVKIHNPNSFGLSLDDADIDYRLFMNGVKLAKGGKQGVNVPKGNSTHDISTQMLQNNIPKWWVKHLNREETSKVKVAADISLSLGPLPIDLNGVSYSTSIETDIIGMIDSSLAKMEGEYQGPGVSVAGVTERPTIEIRGGSAEWGKVTPEKTELIMSFNIHNPNDYPIPTPQLNGDFKMNGIKVADWQANEVTVLNAPSNSKINPGETREMKFLVKIQNRKVDDWLTSHVDNEEQTDAVINIQLGFDFGGTTMKVPPGGGLECDFNFQTGILVDDQNSSSSFNGCSSGTLNRNSESSSEDSLTDGFTGTGDTTNSTDSDNSTDSQNDSDNDSVLGL